MFKHGGEVDESGTAENREESKITNQILTCPVLVVINQLEG